MKLGERPKNHNFFEKSYLHTTLNSQKKFDRELICPRQSNNLSATAIIEENDSFVPQEEALNVCLDPSIKERKPFA